MGKEQAKIVALELLDMSGGLNSNPLSTKVKDNECIDAQNVVWRDQSIYKVPGFSMYSSFIGGAESTKKITGIFDFQKRDGTQYLIVTTEDDIINFTSSPGTSIKGALTVSNALHQFVSFNDRLIATNFTDAPWAWSGAGNAVTLASLCGVNLPPAQAKLVATFNSRVCFGNYIDNVGGSRPTAVAFSAIDNSASYDLTNQTWEFETDDAQEITGMRQLKDKFIVYKDNSIGVVSGYGTQSWTVQRDFVKGIGCVSGYTVKTGFLPVGGSLREVHIFLSQEGLKAFDGVNVYHLPMPGDGEDYKCFEYFDGMAKELFETTVGEWYRKRNWYFGFFANSGSSVNDRGFIYDYQTNSLWPLVGIRATCASTRFNTTTKEYEMLIGTEDGRVLKMAETDESIDDHTELLTNGSMEADANWTSYGSPTTNDRSAVQYLNGSWARRVITDATSEGIYQDITTVVGERYRIYAYAWVTAGQAIIEKQDTDGTDLATGNTATAAAWTRLSVNFTATATTSRIIFRNGSTAASTFYIDDASVRNCDINAFWESKDFDFGTEQDVKLLREFVPFASEQGNFNVQFTLTYDKGSSATTDNLNLSQGSPIWNQFIWNQATWGGKEEINDDLENLTQDAFRTLRIKFANPYGGQPFNINKIYMSAQPLGRRWYHNS